MRAAAPSSIGDQLRDAREERALSIEETAWRTRIRPDLLRALEREDFDEIGHRAFVRRHLHSYARFLGIDPSRVVEEFESRHEPEPSQIEELERQRKGSRKPPRPKWLIAAALSALVMIAAALAGVLGGKTERPSPQAAAIASALPSGAALAEAMVRVRLEVTASARTEISVRADGKEAFEGTLGAGQSRTFRAHDVVEIVAANGGTIRLTLNGAQIASGEPGAVFRARFGPSGALPS